MQFRFSEIGLDIYFGISEIIRTREASGEHANAIRLAPRAFADAERLSCQGYVLFGCRAGAQREIRHRLFPQRRDRPRQADGVYRSFPQSAAPFPPSAYSAA